MRSFDLSTSELTAREIYRNLPPSVLYEHAIRYDKEATIAENSALVAYSGEKTGRSPKDKRVVKNPASEKRNLELGSRAAYPKQAIRNALIEQRQYINESGEDHPFVLGWKWGENGPVARSSTEADNL